MNILVLGRHIAQLTEYRNRRFTQGAIHRVTTGTVVDGPNTYFLFVAKPDDERVMGFEFDQMIVLPDTMTFGSQYHLRVRPRKENT